MSNVLKTHRILDSGNNGSSNGEYIPLSGTEVGNPVTGDIEIIAPNTINGIFANSGDSNKSYVGFTDEYYPSLWYQDDTMVFGKVLLTGESLQVNSDFTTFKGIDAAFYYAENYDDVTYVQKKYADNQIVTLDYGAIELVGGLENFQVYTTGTGTGTASVDLSPTAVIGKDVTVSDLGNNCSTHNIQIDAGVGNTILVAGSSPTQDITLNTNGASVTLRKLTSTQWVVISKNN